MDDTEKYIFIISVLEVLNTGDQPIKVLAEDENVYVIKHNIKGYGFTNLAREWISYRLFKHFNVVIPKADLLHFNPMLFQDELRSLTGKFKEHIVFGSKWLQARDDLLDEMYVGRADSKEKLYNPEELAKIFVMDLWLKNSDRQPLNLNMIVSGEKLYAIDHSATFDQEAFNTLTDEDKKNYFVHPGEVGDLIINSHYFQYYLRQHYNDFEKAGVNLCDEIDKTDAALLHSVLNTLPGSWQITNAEKQAISEYLIYRKSKIKELFLGHLTFSR